MSAAEDRWEYERLLKEIAQTQRQLLSYCLDWESRAPLTPPAIQRVGLFGRKEVVPPAYRERQELLAHLERLKGQARNACSRLGKKGSYFWWEVPWEQLEGYLLFDLAEPEEVGSWRFERGWEKYQGENDICQLVFREEGHCSAFNGQQYLDYYKTSPYSLSEREEMIRRRKDEVRQREFAAALALSGKVLYSPVTNTVYRSVEDYLFSAEHYLAKDHFNQKFEESLYQEHERNRVRAVSRSIHYHSKYLTAEYHVTFLGCLDMWHLGGYSLIDGSGHLTEEVVARRQEKDAAVSSAAYIALQKDVVVIPGDLFGSHVLESEETPEDAVRYAELFTCVADKLSI